MTINGLQSDAEVRDFLTEKNSEVGQTVKGYREQVAPIWAMSDANANDNFNSDLNAFLARWILATTKVTASLDTQESALKQGLGPLALLSLSPQTLKTFRAAIPAQSEFDMLLGALQKTPGQFQKGDFPELTNRLSIISNDLGIDGFQVKTVQPDAIDIDLDGFQAADATVKAGEKAASQTVNHFPLILAGVALTLGALFVIKKV